MLILLILLLAQEILLPCILILCICRPPRDIITVLRGQYPFRLAHVRMGSSCLTQLPSGPLSLSLKNTFHWGLDSVSAGDVSPLPSVFTVFILLPFLWGNISGIQK